MRAGELAHRTGVSARALRYYDQQGLLHPQRTKSGHRIYDDQDIDRVRFFQLMYAAGLNSTAIAALLPCIDTGHSDAETLRLLLDERQRITEQVRKLTTALNNLDILIETAGGNPRHAVSSRFPAARSRPSVG